MPASSRTTVAAISAGVALLLGVGAWFVVRNVDLPFFSRAPEPTLRNGGLMRELLADRAAAGGEPAFIGEVPEEDAKLLFAMLSSIEAEYHPGLYFKRAPNLSSGRRFAEAPNGMWKLRTNSQGFREDSELPASPDKRVLVIGDSHTDGVCGNRRSFANRLETHLGEQHPDVSIDVVNAGVGGYSFYNFYRALDVYVEDLQVDAVVCAIYGGNDFLEALAPRHYFQRTEVSTGGEGYARALEDFGVAWNRDVDAVVAQGVQQLAFLNHAPEEAALALETAARLTRLMHARAEELGVALVFVYIPSAWDLQLERYTDVPRSSLEDALALRDHKTHDAWADEWIGVVREIGRPHLDMRPIWRGLDEDLYWHQDHHINIAAQESIALALVDIVRPLLDL